MFLFGRKKKTSKTGLIVSVEHSHIRACFVSVHAYQKPYIIEEAITRFQETKQHEELFKILRETLRTLHDKKPTKIDFAISCLGTPWFFSHTDTHVRDEETPFVFRERDIKKILKDAVSDIHKELGPSFGPIEKNILHIGLNGYEVSSFSAREVRRAEVTTYVSFGNKALLQGIEREIEAEYSVTPTFQTATLVQSVVARDAFQYLEHFILVSLDGERTEVSLVSDGALVFGDSFDEGEHLFEKKAEFLGYDKKTLLGELAVSWQGKLEHSLSEPLVKVMGLAQEEWRQKFVKILETYMHHTSIPHEVVVVAKPQTFHWVRDAIQDSRNKHLSLSLQNLHAILMDKDALQPFVGAKIGDPDLKLMIYASFTTLK